MKKKKSINSLNCLKIWDVDFVEDKNMKFKMVHNNLNVFELSKSLEFYDKALGLKEVSRMEAQDGSFIIVFLADN